MLSYRATFAALAGSSTARRALLDEAVRFTHELGVASYEPEARWSRGLTALIAGDLVAARSDLEEAAQLAAFPPITWLQPRTTLARARLERAEGDATRAEELAQESLALAAALTASAVALVCGSALFVAGGTANWLMHVGDHFAERSPGWYLLSASAPLHLAGALVVLAGVTSAALS